MRALTTSLSLVMWCIGRSCPVGKMSATLISKISSGDLVWTCDHNVNNFCNKTTKFRYKKKRKCGYTLKFQRWVAENVVWKVSCFRQILIFSISVRSIAGAALESLVIHIRNLIHTHTKSTHWQVNVQPWHHPEVEKKIEAHCWFHVYLLFCGNSRRQHTVKSAV